jgi:hypothetical protein
LTVNPAYKHLRARLRIGELTVPQMIALFCGLMAGLGWALYLSPFSPYLTLFISIYLACIPTGTVLLASTTEFDLWLYFRACVRDAFSDGEYLAGPGAPTDGYAIDPDGDASSTPPGAARRLDLEEIWGF